MNEDIDRPRTDHNNDNHSKKRQPSYYFPHLAMSSSLKNRPTFAELPLAKDGPRLNAWGLWGPGDQLGTLNLLTDDVVARAAEENIKTGVRVSLK